jgi:rod shape determining protein RodA
MQESWGSWNDRVSRLGWEGASERQMAWRAPWRHYDPITTVAACALAVFGLAAIYSATFASLRLQGLPGSMFMRRQLISLVVGVVATAAVTFVDYHRLLAWAPVAYGAMVLGLAAVLTPLGSQSNGAQSWFSLGPFQLQPSEFAKIALILTLAAILGSRGERPVRPGPKRIALALGALGLVAGEILLQPDFGTMMVFVAILFGILLTSGARFRWLLALVLIGSIGVVGMFKMNVLKEYQKERLTAFVNPSADASGRGFTYNYRQSLIAIGSGGLTGKGYLRGTQTNLQYVPEQRTDFIFTVVGEELGFLGSALLLALLGLLVWRGLRIAAMARDPAGALIAAGVISMLVFQTFINVGMTIGIMPITGIPLPFVSYGGSSLIASFLAIGLLENVHMRRFAPT